MEGEPWTARVQLLAVRCPEPFIRLHGMSFRRHPTSEGGISGMSTVSAALLAARALLPLLGAQVSAGKTILGRL
jgi:hypothetical protein